MMTAPSPALRLRYSIHHSTGHGLGLRLGYVWADSWTQAFRRAGGAIARGLPFVVTPESSPEIVEADRRRFAWLYAQGGCDD